MTDLFIHLSDLQSAALYMLLVFGFALILPVLVNRRSTWQRATLFTVAFVLAVRYAWWRATETIAPFGLNWDWAASWALLGLELAAMIGSISSFVILSRTRDRTREVIDNASWWAPEPPPRVAILIATYNEDEEVLERTIIGATSLDYPNKEVLILDDGRRDWLRDFCAGHGVRYLRRDDSKGSKAGNINNALRVLGEDAQPPDFVAVLDADFVPHRDFLNRTLALFHDPETGLVQTPQHFFNPDPIQHNLDLARSYPDEQRFFFDHLQPARDAWGIAFCCGTSSVTRWRALQEVGGFPTDSITEDFMLTLVLQDKGWRTAYLNQPLTEGLAPEGLKEYITQRARWCLGLMQIARSRVGPLARNNLRLRDRWSVVDSVLFWLTTFPFRIAAIGFPLLYWFFNITVVDASVADVLRFFGPYYLWTMLALNIVSRGMIVPVVNDVSQLLGAIPIARAAIVGLIKPKGHPFSVTAKGGDRSKIVVQWRMMMPYLVMFILTVIGLTIGIVSDHFAFYDAGDGKAVILYWTIYNLIVLATTLLAFVELPRRERHVMDRPERAVFVSDRGERDVWLSGLTRDTARLRGGDFIEGEHGALRIREVGDVEITVLNATDDGARLHLMPTDNEYKALLKRFHTRGSAPGVTRVRLGAVLHDVAWRLSFNRKRG